MSKRTQVKNQIKTIRQKYLNIKTACKAQKYDIAFQVAKDILNESPNDDFALYIYASCLCIDGQIEQARQYFEHLTNSKDDYIRQKSKENLMYIAFNQNNFDAAYDHLMELDNLHLDRLRMYEMFLDYQVYGIIADNLPEQWHNYDREKALEQIITKFGSNSAALGTFHENIDIEELFNQATETIETIPRSLAFNPLDRKYPHYIYNQYYLSLKNIGNYHNHTSNFVLVASLPFTSNIVTMYPTSIIPIESTPIELAEEQKVKIIRSN